MITQARANVSQMSTWKTILTLIPIPYEYKSKKRKILSIFLDF